MHLVTAELGVRRAIAVVERDRLGRALDGALHALRGEQYALGVIRGARELQTLLEQPLAQACAPHLDADLGQDALGFVQDRRQQVIGDDAKSRSHYSPSGPASARGG